MSALEIAFIAKELSSAAGMYLDRFYESEGGAFTLKFSSRGKACLISCVLPNCINITGYSRHHGEPTNFAMAVRKRAEGFILDGVEQLGGDRIILMKFRKGDSIVSMVFELFGKGNLIIADGSMNILFSYSQKDFRDRSTKSGRKYELPAGQPVTLGKLEMLHEAVMERAREHGQEGLVAALSKTINLGALYLENAVLAEGLDPEGKIGEQKESDMERVLERIKGYASEIPQPRIYRDERGNPVDYAVCDIKKYSGFAEKRFETVSAMLDDIYVGEGKAEVPDKLKREIEETKASMEKQKEAVERLRHEAAECKLAANEIHLRLSEINEFIYNASKIKKPTLEELKALSGTLKVISFDPVEKSVVLEIEVHE
jgi:predicted ribosome quality control (RQC) complex YloA/Tae2 family protein